MSKRDKRMQRKRRVRAKVSGTKERPRLSVFRSNKNLFVQLVNDEKDETIVSLSSRSLAEKDKKGKTKVEIAGIVGEEVAKEAKKKKIKKAVFDRGGYQYHGRVGAVAEGARKGGLDL
jgi:large subunit ribosomal protein L18